MRDQTPTPELPSGAPDWEALARFLTGESTAEERAAVSQWMAARPGHAQFVTALGKATQRVGLETPEGLDVEDALARVRQRMREPVLREPVLRVLPPDRAAAVRSRPAFHWQRAAMGAAAMVVAAAGLTLWRQGRSAGGDPVAVSAARVFATAVGQRDSTRLPDGTRVLLGPGSRLTVAAGFAEGRRDVELLGDAFFDVTHDAAHPFAVRALDAVISDVGTSFAVHGDRGDGVHVSVASGAVELRSAASGAGAGVVLQAGDAGAMDANGTVTAQRGGASAEDTAWTRGRLVFRDAPLAKVRADLRRWYGVELVSSDSLLARRHVTASFLNDPTRQVLKVITLALGASYELRGDTVMLRAVEPPARTRR